MHERNPWTTAEVKMLREFAGLGAVGVSELIGRSRSSVEMMAHRLRISLRSEGQRRGRWQGRALDSPEAKRLIAQLHADVDSGRVAARREERRIHLILQGAPLCPKCSKRIQTMVGEGVCEVCYLRAKVEAHAEIVEAIRVRKELDKQRSRKARARRSA